LKIVTAIPVHGRHRLLIKTLSRLKRQTLPLHEVVVIGSTNEDRKLAESVGCGYIYHENQPLGKKWQHGIDHLMTFNPDAVLILGSSDWISDYWCEHMADEMGQGFDMVGKKEIFFLDVGKGDDKRLMYWKGYFPKKDPHRFNEPIGAGRLISRRILDELNWQIFDVRARSSMDWISYRKIVRAGGKVKCVTDGSIEAMSISHHEWNNLHSFDKELKNPMAMEIKDKFRVLKNYFPDAVDFS
jgi:glycosyltransferase involved in cell wall biosynthesis